MSNCNCSLLSICFCFLCLCLRRSRSLWLLSLIIVLSSSLIISLFIIACWVLRLSICRYCCWILWLWGACVLISTLAQHFRLPFANLTVLCGLNSIRICLTLSIVLLQFTLICSFMWWLSLSVWMVPVRSILVVSLCLFWPLVSCIVGSLLRITHTIILNNFHYIFKDKQIIIIL